MERFTTAVYDALNARNWFGALFIALALPDICGALEDPGEAVGIRYKRWFEKYLGDHYRQMLSAEDCYYFRCACVHEGTATYDKGTGDRIHFTHPRSQAYVHGNWVNGSLQLSIDVFCADVCIAVGQWQQDTAARADVKERLKELIAIHLPLL